MKVFQPRVCASNGTKNQVNGIPKKNTEKPKSIKMGLNHQAAVTRTTVAETKNPSAAPYLPLNEEIPHPAIRETIRSQARLRYKV